MSKESMHTGVVATEATFQCLRKNSCVLGRAARCTCEDMPFPMHCVHFNRIFRCADGEGGIDIWCESVESGDGELMAWEIEHLANGGTVLYKLRGEDTAMELTMNKMRDAMESYIAGLPEDNANRAFFVDSLTPEAASTIIQLALFGPELVRAGG